MELFFSATVTNLQQKLESVQTTNTLLKEDLAIAKNTALELQAENDTLKNDQGSLVDDTKKQLEVGTCCVYLGKIYQISHYNFLLVINS
jgi:hypothetical protein